MGNITNLATIGNYAFEAGSLKVTFGFQIDNESGNLKRIDNGSVIEDGQYVADFSMQEYLAQNKRISYVIERGRETEAINAITAAIADLEKKSAEGAIVE